jgi:hypothetical protein
MNLTMVGRTLRCCTAVITSLLPGLLQEEQVMGRVHRQLRARHRLSSSCTHDMYMCIHTRQSLPQRPAAVCIIYFCTFVVTLLFLWFSFLSRYHWNGLPPHGPRMATITVTARMGAAPPVADGSREDTFQSCVYSRLACVCARVIDVANAGQQHRLLAISSIDWVRFVR